LTGALGIAYDLPRELPGTNKALWEPGAGSAGFGLETAICGRVESKRDSPPKTGAIRDFDTRAAEGRAHVAKARIAASMTVLVAHHHPADRKTYNVGLTLPLSLHNTVSPRITAPRVSESVAERAVSRNYLIRPLLWRGRSASKE
jgi:hypothetical protein